jgi:hypothetical protein
MNADELIAFWRQCPSDKANYPYLHPQDEPGLPGKLTCKYSSYDDFSCNEYFEKKKRHILHIGLLPIPYIGDIQNASVYVLMLNPGLSPGDYFLENGVEQYRNALVNNLYQTHGNTDYPFLFLDPKYGWHPGAEYWSRRFGAIVGKKGTDVRNYQAIMKILARRVAVLQLVPYHSRAFGNYPLKELSSVTCMKQFFTDTLMPRVERNEITVIVARGARYWGISNICKNNLVVHKNNEARSGYLTLESHNAIAERLGLNETAMSM